MFAMVVLLYMMHVILSLIITVGDVTGELK